MFNYDIFTKRQLIKLSGIVRMAIAGNAVSVSFIHLSYKILVESDEPGFPMVVKNENSLDHPCRLIILCDFLF